MLVVDPIIRSVRPRESRQGPACMNGDETNVLREERLVSVVDMDGDIRPPEEGLRQVRSIVEPDVEADRGTVAREVNPVSASHPCEGVVINQPGRHRAVAVLLDG